MNVSGSQRSLWWLRTATEIDRSAGVCARYAGIDVWLDGNGIISDLGTIPYAF